VRAAGAEAGKGHHRERVADPPVVLGAVQAEPAKAVADVLGKSHKPSSLHSAIGRG
jgi:hypothetical protein